MARASVVVALVIGALGCSGKAELEPAVQATALMLPAATPVTADGGELLLRYRDEAGAWQTATSLAEVPAGVLRR